MANNRRELVVAIVSDASTYSKGLDQASRQTQSFGKEMDRAAKGGVGQLDSRVSAVSANLRTLGAIAGGAVVGQKIIGFAQDSVKAFSDLNESINATNVTFGDSADGIQQLGREAADALGLSNAEFNNLSVSFSAFADAVSQEGGGSVIQVIDDLTTRASDFASVMNLDVNDAVEKFRSGLAGETEPVRQFGIDLSAARVNARALAEGLADTASELTESDKIYARYLELMDQTEKTAGDFAATSDELANSQRRLAAKVEDAQAAIGQKLAGAFEDAIDIGLAWVDVADRIFNKINEMGEQEGRSGLGQFFDVAGWKPLLDFLKVGPQLIDNLFNSFEDKGFENVMSDEERFGPLRVTEEMRRNVAGVEAEYAKVGAAAAMTADQVTADGERAASVSWRNRTISELASSLRDAETAARNTRLAILEATNPAFAAVNARQREADAAENLKTVREDEESTAKDIAAAEAELAQARIEAYGALEEFDASGPAGQVKTISDALGVSISEAQELLETLGVLDGNTITVPVVFELQSRTAPSFDEITRYLPPGGTVPNRGGSTTNITVNNPQPNAAPQDIQRELILNRVRSFAE